MLTDVTLRLGSWFFHNIFIYYYLPTYSSLSLMGHKASVSSLHHILSLAAGWASSQPEIYSHTCLLRSAHSLTASFKEPECFHWWPTGAVHSESTHGARGSEGSPVAKEVSELWSWLSWFEAEQRTGLHCRVMFYKIRDNWGDWRVMRQFLPHVTLLWLQLWTWQI